MAHRPGEGFAARPGEGANIDHIIVSRGFALGKLEFWPAMIGELKSLTDHYGVYAELQDAAAATA